METDFSVGESQNSRLALERVFSDLRALSSDAEDLLKATASNVDEKAREARTRLTDAIKRAKTTCNDLQQETITKARAAARRADGVIRTHPYEAVGAGFGIGLLLGFIFGRK